MPTAPLQEIHLFPLGTVLFPEGLLPLKVFEQRYIEMTKTCIRDNRPFGVCLIREGREVGTASVPESVGCLAMIEQWEMPQLGVFQIAARGGSRFRVRDMRVAANHLITAEVEQLPADHATGPVDAVCRQVLEAVVEKVGAVHFPAPRLDDPAWVGFRLAEILPIEPRVKQSLLEMTDAGERLARLRELLLAQGIATG